MSDLFKTRKKVEEGAQWTGQITVSIDDEEHNLTIRQLRDPEFWEVMSLVDMDEIEELQDTVPDDIQDELQELQTKDSLTDEEKERLEELKSKVEGDADSVINMFDILSDETFEGITKAAKYGVIPDEEDKRYALTEHAGEIDEKYGGTTDEEAAEYVQDHVINPMIDRSTGFTSFAIGIKTLTESIGDTGNSND